MGANHPAAGNSRFDRRLGCARRPEAERPLSREVILRLHRAEPSDYVGGRREAAAGDQLAIETMCRDAHAGEPGRHRSLDANPDLGERHRTCVPRRASPNGA